MEQDKQRQQQPALMEAVDRLMSSIAGQQHTPPPAEVQQQDMIPLPPADPTKGNQMDTGPPETETSQGDILMGDGDGVHEANDKESEGTAKET